MQLAIISFARKGSTRLPGKNSMKLRGVPLIWYTLRAMNFFYIKCVLRKIECERYLLTDCEECRNYAIKMNMPVIWRDHPKDWDDTRLNMWAHEKIFADNYLLLQPTSPFRDKIKMFQWLLACLKNNVKSAFAVKKIDGNNFKRAGSFFYYSKKMLDKYVLNDSDSIIFQHNDDIDIDTMDDFREAEKRIDEN